MMGVSLNRDRGNYMVDNYEDKFVDRMEFWFHFEIANNRESLKHSVKESRFALPPNVESWKPLWNPP